MPPAIKLKPLYHRQHECIGLYYDNNSSLNNIVKKIPGIKWSQTNRCWWLPLSKENYNKLHFALEGKAEIATGRVIILLGFSSRLDIINSSTAASPTRQTVKKLWLVLKTFV